MKGMHSEWKGYFLNESHKFRMERRQSKKEGKLS